MPWKRVSTRIRAPGTTRRSPSGGERVSMKNPSRPSPTTSVV